MKKEHSAKASDNDRGGVHCQIDMINDWLKRTTDYLKTESSLLWSGSSAGGRQDLDDAQQLLATASKVAHSPAGGSSRG